MNDLLRTHYWKNRERKTAFAVQDSNPWPREIGAYHWALDHWATTAVELHWCVQHVFAFQLKDVDFYFFDFFPLFLIYLLIFFSCFRNNGFYEMTMFHVARSLTRTQNDRHAIVKSWYGKRSFTGCDKSSGRNQMLFQPSWHCINLWTSGGQVKSE